MCDDECYVCMLQHFYEKLEFKIEPGWLESVYIERGTAGCVN